MLGSSASVEPNIDVGEKATKVTMKKNATAPFFGNKILYTSIYKSKS